MAPAITRRTSIVAEENEFDAVRRRGSADLLTKASPFGHMLENVRKAALGLHLWSDDMQRDIPKKWEKHGDMIIFPQHAFRHENWRFIGRDLWRIVAESLRCGRVGRKRQIPGDAARTAHVDILYGEHGWVEHEDERGIRYVYDASQKVFDIGKLKEMGRIAKMDCHGETVVDMFAALGYHTLPFSVSAGAKQVIAIDWDETACEALVRSTTANTLEGKIDIIQGDSRRVTPQCVADRVYLSALPNSRAFWLTACRALKQSGGMLHIHETVNKNATKKQAPLRREMRVEKPAPTKLDSVDEDGLIASVSTSKEEEKKVEKKEVKENETEEKKEGDEENSEPPVRRKFSRSASIVEEMESRVFPDATVYADFKAEFEKLPPSIKLFAEECAANITRYLNNIHHTDAMYACVIVNVSRLSSSPSSDAVVLDLLCAPHTAPLEKLACSKFVALPKKDNASLLNPN